MSAYFQKCFPPVREMPINYEEVFSVVENQKSKANLIALFQKLFPKGAEVRKENDVFVFTHKLQNNPRLYLPPEIRFTVKKSGSVDFPSVWNTPVDGNMICYFWRGIDAIDGNYHISYDMGNIAAYLGQEKQIKQHRVEEYLALFQA